jgi:hypothetical protein
MGRAMNVPTAIMLTESHTHISILQIDIITKGSGDANTQTLTLLSMPLWRTPLCRNLLLCNFRKNYAPQASLLKSSIVELTDNSITVASYLEDGTQYGQNGYCGHNSVVKLSTDKDSSLKLYHGLCTLYIP